MGETFITRVELANELKVSPSTIYNWTRWHWIPSHKMGGRLVRYKLNEVLAALGTPEVELKTKNHEA